MKQTKPEEVTLMKVGINGFGRIGRLTFRGWLKNRSKYNFEVVAVNDIGDPKTMAHLLKHDSTFGTLEEDVRVEGDSLVVGNHKIRIFSERDPANIPWGQLGVEYVIESSGVFRSREKASAHLKGGAKRVIISAPAKGDDISTFVLGVNEESFNPEKDDIISNASCTTNCLAPFVKVLHENYTIKNGLMTTIHSYTNDQALLDQPHSDLRRARAGAINIIPTSTGAAKAIGKVIPDLKGKVDGLAIRVPTHNVSVVDFVCVVEKPTTKEEINQKLRDAAGSGRLQGILGVSDEPLVSLDFVGDNRSSIVDAENTFVTGGTTIKVMAWYDNEWAYSIRLLDFVAYMMKKAPAGAKA
jgi:glyceraldehyde 3-phosphate dehydrogenase